MTFIVWLKRLPQELESSLRLVRSSCDCTPIGTTSQTARLAGSKPWLLLLALHKWCVVVQNCHLYQKLDFLCDIVSSRSVWTTWDPVLKMKKIKDEKEEEKEKGGGRNGFLREDGTSWHFSWSMRHERISQATSQMLSQRFWLFSVSSFHLLGWHCLQQGPELGCSPWQLLSSRWWRLTSVPAVCRDTWSLEALCLLQRAHVTLCQLPPSHPTVVCQSVVYTGSFPGLTTITLLQHPQMATLQGFIWLAIWLVS